MDYIALNHQAHNYGIHYNSSSQIGGINYYIPEKKIVKVKKHFGRTKVIVEIEDRGAGAENQSELDKEKIVAEEIQIEREAQAEKTLQAIDQNSTEIKEVIQGVVEDLSNNANAIAENFFKREYLVHIQSKEVNFADLGIHRAPIHMQDRQWLAKAQNYFITAKEDGIRIGSAEDFTSMEILEALWSTAEHVGIDPKRFIVQIYNESRFNPNSRGQAGERGIGQFKEGTAEAYHYDWEAMTDGIEGFAYQALAAADFVKKVGELAYNGGGDQAEKYQKKINHRLGEIADADTDCIMSNTAYCSS